MLLDVHAVLLDHNEKLIAENKRLTEGLHETAWIRQQMPYCAVRAHIPADTDYVAPTGGES